MHQRKKQGAYGFPAWYRNGLVLYLIFPLSPRHRVPVSGLPLVSPSPCLRVPVSVLPRVRRTYSHSMVLGGLDEMSKTTRFTPFTSLMIRLDMMPRSS
jgi:hypothetical protein